MAKRPAKGSAPAKPGGARAAAPARAANPAPTTRPSLRVRAKEMGIYEHGRRRAGNVFTLKAASEFRPKWMEWVDATTPERVTGPKAALAEQHDAILGGTVKSGETGDGSSGHGDIGKGPDDVL